MTVLQEDEKHELFVDLLERMTVLIGANVRAWICICFWSVILLSSGLCIASKPYCGVSLHVPAALIDTFIVLLA